MDHMKADTESIFINNTVILNHHEHKTAQSADELLESARVDVGCPVLVILNASFANYFHSPYEKDFANEMQKKDG